MIVYNINRIQNGMIYTTQGKIEREILIIKTKELLITSLVIADATKNRIEIVAFGMAAEHIIKQKLTVGSMYQFKNLKATINDKYRKTTHPCKLTFTNHSKIKKIECLEFKKKEKLFVTFNNKKTKKTKNIEQQNIKQLQVSIKSYFKRN